MRVTCTLQSGKSDPVVMKLASNTDALGALHAVASQLDIDRADEAPWKPTLISITIEINPEKETV